MFFKKKVNGFKETTNELSKKYEIPSKLCVIFNANENAIKGFLKIKEKASKIFDEDPDILSNLKSNAYAQRYGICQLANKFKNDDRNICCVIDVIESSSNRNTRKIVNYLLTERM